MYQFNNLTSNVPNVQTFNTGNPITYLSQGTTSYVYLGVNSGGVPAANGNFYQRTTTTVAYFKIDSTGVTAPTPKVNDRFTYGDGTTNGWINATITAINDNTTYWVLTLGTAFAGTLTTSSTYTLDDLRPNSNWQIWTKPNDAMLIHILCIGGGGGGGSGRKDSTGTTRFGGGGGGSSAVTSMYVPAFLIPDTLYVQVGLGGAGGAAQTVFTNGNAGANGGYSYVAFYPDFNLGNLLLSANGGSAGGGGTASAGTAGAAGTALSISSSSPFYLGLGQWTSTTGQAGSSSSATAVPTALTISGVTCGGAAGGGVSSSNIGFAGGAINSPSVLIPYLTSLSGGAASASSPATNNGYVVKKPLMFIGGAGSGASAVVGSGSLTGGNGAIGCGGGGSGATILTNSGAGGKGGNGIVIITSYSI